MTFESDTNPLVETDSQNFEMTVDEIVEEAFDLLQIGVEGEDLTADMYKRGRRSLNLMLQSVQTDGLTLAVQEDGALFLRAGVERYDLSDTTTNKITNRYYETTLAADADSPDSTITVSSDDDINDGDTIGILLDDNSIQWTTVNGAPAADVVTLDDNITGPAASGNQVFNFRDTFKKVSRILDFRRTDFFTNDTPMDHTTRQTYFNLPNKSTTGIPVQIYHDRGKNEVFMYPAPQDSCNIVKFMYEIEIPNAENGSEKLTLPKYALEKICLGLASRLTMKYRVPDSVKQDVQNAAKVAWDKEMVFDDEVGSLHVVLNREGF